jgi:site-specific recombinase XerD
MKTESADVTLGTLMQAFFLERLIAQRNASRQTVAAYRDSFRLLLHFAERHLGKAPERLALTDVDAPLVLAFLDHLERDRRNTIRSRNARLAAIRSFVHFAAFKEPAALPSLQRVLAIPMKRFDKPLLGFLSKDEIQAILDAPPANRWSGQRDRIMFATLYNSGARVSELTGLRVADVHRVDFRRLLELHAIHHHVHLLNTIPCIEDRMIQRQAHELLLRQHFLHFSSDRE